MKPYERAKEVARKQGLSLQTVATQAGMGINSIYRWKNTTPQSDKVKAVADVLHVSVDYLLGNTDNPNPPENTIGTKRVDLKTAMQDDNTLLAWDGRPIPDEEKEMIRRILDGGNK